MKIKFVAVSKDSSFKMSKEKFTGLDEGDEV